ncbi:MAG TPA: hemolysin III family protein [Candidatus Hydrogenedentes bacterium]|nr:hemolysin III family protein [Candidatus Hydrogenedentota bacterium]HOV73678.1 hemolysin III family protein [Candidatus Hydrogenedentota bacterium]HPC16277.1 hemolysin III family protein [Candidatus Hydrogenedentota bacterium]HRT21659.1 hemolysin III family protein [Candidatus Hydrogenedentota bacterium]HRT66891.1 hemolysin III family protein [Candidatus Hydrogenedentota bacterium]
MKRFRYSLAEDIANSVTHGIGAALSIAGLTVLVVFASLKGDPWRIVSLSIYGSTLVALFLTSTLYHGIQSPRAKEIFRRLDHVAIFLLIAGTYTPFTLVTMRGGVGWIMFAAVWALAVFGVLLKAFYMGRFERLSLALYLGMGWIALLSIKPAMAMIPGWGLIGMLIGGLFYTFGVVFYAWERLPFGHSIWHVFVLAGSISHFFTILFVVS